MRINLFSILIYIATGATALMSVTDVLPKSWLPVLIVVATLANAFTPRAARRRALTDPPRGRR